MMASSPIYVVNVQGGTLPMHRDIREQESDHLILLEVVKSI